jgi:integrase
MTTEDEPKKHRKKRYRVRGLGSVFLRGKVWWYAFNRNKLEYRESSNDVRKTVAIEKLKARIKEIDTMGLVKTDHTVGDLMEAVFLDYKNNGKRSLDDAKQRWETHLKPVFENLRASRITTDMLEEYVSKRDDKGAKLATVNRELALLRRAFRLGHRSTPRKVAVIPYFPLRKEENTRTGFLADADYDKLAAACTKRGLWLRAMLEVGFQFGWRAGEVRSLRVRHVDLAARTLRLDSHTTKNGEARVAVMPSNLFVLVQQCATGKNPEDALFTRDGKAVTDFRGSWELACKEAGVPDLLFHDLRRTACRNMDRRGIPETTIMKIMGLKTRAIFIRYRIGDHEDLVAAARKMEQPIRTVSVQFDDVAPAAPVLN